MEYEYIKKSKEEILYFLSQNRTNNPSLDSHNVAFVKNNNEEDIMIGFKLNEETGNMFIHLALADEIKKNEEKFFFKEKVKNSYFAHVTYQGEIIVSCSQECEHEDGIDVTFKADTKEEAYQIACEYLYE